MIFEYQIIFNNNKPQLDIVKEINEDECCEYTYDLGFYEYLFKKYYKLDELFVERSFCVALDYNGRILGLIMVSSGSTVSCNMYKKIIATFSLLVGAEKIILIHNHPNCALEPSEGDLNCNQVIVDMTKLIDVELIYNLILCRQGVLDIISNKKQEIGSEYENEQNYSDFMPQLIDDRER